MKGKGSKTRYNIYKTRYQLALTDKKLAKAIKQEFGNATPNDIYGKYAVTATMMQDSIAHRCSAEELHWFACGKKTIFLTEDLIKMLARAKFTMSESAKIEPLVDFESVTIAVPKNTFVTDENGDEIEILPFLLSCLSTKDSINKIMGNYERLTGVESKESAEFLKDPKETLITLTYELDGVSYQTTEKSSSILNLLKNGLRDNPSSHNHQLLDNEERRQGQMMFRIATAFIIYTNAKNGENIKDGYPSDCVFDINTCFNRAYWNATYADIPQRKSKPTKDEDGRTGYKQSWNVRSAHMKNLSHERFYQGEHAWRPRESRWILVDEYEAGEKITAHHSE